MPDVTVAAIHARLGGFSLSLRSGVWHCNGYTGPTLELTICRALRGYVRFLLTN